MIGSGLALAVLAALGASAGPQSERLPAICIDSFTADGFDEVAAQLLRQKLEVDLRDAGNVLVLPGRDDVDLTCPVPAAAAAPGSLGLLTVAARRVGPTMRVRLTVRDALSQTVVLDQRLKLSTTELGRRLTFVPHFKRALAGLRRLQQRALRELLQAEGPAHAASAPQPSSAPAVEPPIADPVVTATGASEILTQPGIDRAAELRTWGWMAAAIGTALVAAGASTGISARVVDNHLKSLGREQCAYIADNRWQCAPEQSITIALLYTLAHTTNVLLGAGGAAALGATGLFIWSQLGAGEDRHD
ncbi:MAG: hypothetical protein JXR83_16265 [Deltaproteobacteria bacterium]|nr:hypothetical protein [Deltaproteobacteria bacterium]